MSKKFRHLDLSPHWQQYFSKYPQGYTIIENLIDWVSQVDDMVDNQNELTDTVGTYTNRMDEFIGQYDTHLQETVEHTLSDWQASGFLNMIINKTLDTKYHEMDKRLTTGLSETVKRGENESITKGMLAQDIKQDLSNGELTFKLNTSEIEEGAISPAKTDFISVTSTNLFNKNDILEKTTISSDTGNYQTHDTLTSSKSFLKVRLNTDYTFKGLFAIALYDSEHTFIGRWTSDGDMINYAQTINSDNAEYFKFIVRGQDLEMAQFNEGSTLLLYEEYRETLDNRLIGERSVTNENIQVGSVTTDEVDFVTVSSTNLFNQYKMQDGVTVTGEGIEKEHDLLGVSENFLKVTPNEEYTSVKIFRILFYDTQFKLIDVWNVDQTEGQANLPQTLNVGSASYAKFVVRMDRYHDAQFNKGSEALQYEPYKVQLDTNLFETRDDNVYPTRDDNLYPTRLVWGHEYMWSWYDKIRQSQPLKMIWAGDSTTQGGGVSEEYQRHSLGKKILSKGGYPESDVVSINAGNGSRHTGNWLGGEYNDGSYTDDEYNYLDEDMSQNPDLYVFAYGFNDGSNGHFPNLSWDERIDRFERNLNIGLERIRGTTYGKSADDMAIVLCTPISSNGGGGQSPEMWSDRIKPIIQKACRDYHCAFVDITARQYDHKFSNSWSLNGDFVHPLDTANADYMSMFSDLLMPYLLQKD